MILAVTVLIIGVLLIFDGGKKGSAAYDPEAVRMDGLYISFDSMIIGKGHYIYTVSYSSQEDRWCPSRSTALHWHSVWNSIRKGQALRAQSGTLRVPEYFYPEIRGHFSR